MTLKDFLKLLSITHAPVEVRSAYNDKLLCRNVWRNKNEDIMEREVRAIRPEIKADKEQAHAIIFCYVDGMPELIAEMAKVKKE
jgi:hypothetical protein